MLSKVFASELFAMMIAMLLLLSVHAIFVRRSEQVVERFQDSTPSIKKKLLFELGKLSLMNQIQVPASNDHLVKAMDNLKRSSEGFSGSMDAVIALLQKESVFSEKNATTPVERDESHDEELPEEDDVEEEEETVEGFIDASAHDYMCL